ncbi:MAG: hypothetical protein IPM85_11780 [Chitinophagaceae bacterium]|nr:hypothetical protein [Chitinophagaceae bacterium]
MKKVLDVMPYQYLPYFSGGQKSIAQFLDYLGKETDLTVLSVPGNDDKMSVTYRLQPFLKKGLLNIMTSASSQRLLILLKKSRLKLLSGSILIMPGWHLAYGKEPA